MSIIRSIASKIGIVVQLFNEVPQVARYVVIEEAAGGITIPDPNKPLLNDRHLLNIPAPGMGQGYFAVLFFQTRHTGSPRFQVVLNGTTLTHHTFAESGPRSWHEIVRPGVLKPQGNQLDLVVFPEGTVTFSDIFILYTSNHLTVRTPPVLAP